MRISFLDHYIRKQLLMKSTIRHLIGFPTLVYLHPDVSGDVR